MHGIQLGRLVGFTAVPTGVLALHKAAVNASDDVPSEWIHVKVIARGVHIELIRHLALESLREKGILFACNGRAQPKTPEQIQEKCLCDIGLLQDQSVQNSIRHHVLMRQPRVTEPVVLGS